MFGGWPKRTKIAEPAMLAKVVVMTGFDYYKNRYEVTSEIIRAIRRNAAVDELRQIAIREGMTTMGADGVRRAALGQTTLGEVLRLASG